MVKVRIFSVLVESLVYSSFLLSGSATSSHAFQQFLSPDFEVSSGKSTVEDSIIVQQSPNPNRDRLLPSGSPIPVTLPENLEPIPDERTVEDPTTSEPLPSPPDDQIQFSIESIQVVGNTVLSDADITAITAPFVDQIVTLSDLQQVSDSITQLYLELGYITSRAILPEQSIIGGIVQIQVREGSISNIQVNGLSRLNTRYITSRLEQGVTTPFNANTLEEQLRLLRFDPLVEKIQGRLQPSDIPGESILNINVDEVGAWRIGAGVNNYGSPGTGSERLNTSLAYQNVSGWGDTLSASYTRSTTGGANTWDIGYRLPVNALDGAFSLRTAFDNFELTQGPFSGQINGDSDRYEISFRQPLIRSLREEFAISTGFSYRDGKTFIGPQSIANPDNTLSSRTSIFKFGQDYTSRDNRGVWGLRSQFSFGTGLFDATDNPGDTADSQFFSWLGQAQRVQRLSSDNLLIVQADLQLTPDRLLPVEQFLIGGGQSLRGYRQNVRSGDNGFRLSVEDRITLTRDEETENAVIQIAPFFDIGAVWNNGNSTVNQNFIAGAGLGFIYDPFESFNLRIDYALPLVILEDEGNNAQDEGFYFSATYQY
ncbi:MAG: ShlB/FhaC/HecB family hemolysin secretion/activation protein [Cyanobacteria bacterium J06623_4]